MNLFFCSGLTNFNLFSCLGLTNFNLFSCLGLTNLNRAFDGDVVAIELLPEKEWSSAAEIVLEDEGYDPGDTLVNMCTVGSKTRCLVSALSWPLFSYKRV